jgi:acyl-ACP thioesterase
VAPADTVMVPPPSTGRVFTHPAMAGLGDVAPDGRARLDAIARWLQDAAWADFLDAGVPDDGVWIVRRLALAVERFPRFWEPLELDTFCSGSGPLWAERRTTVRGAGGALVETVALWVHLDPAGGRPRPLPEGFEAVYGAAAGGRRVRARLHLPDAPPADAATRPWAFRATDLDMAAHVNNAAYWAVAEEELSGADPGDGYRAAIEHRAPGAGGAGAVAAAGAHRWVLDERGAVLATLELAAG